MTNTKHAETKADREAPRAGTYSVPPEEMLTEQEQDVYADGGNGVGPAPASVDPIPVETMEAQGIGPRDPYPTGDSPPPAESTTRSQGIKGVTDKPSEGPSESKGPVGTTRKDDKK